MAYQYIYRVWFPEPPIKFDSRREFYFTSLAAIYEIFTPEQIGCKVSRLWNIGLSQGATYDGRLCRITKEPISRKKRTKAPQTGEIIRDNNLRDDVKKR